MVNQTIWYSRFLREVAPLSLKLGAQLKKEHAHKVYYVNTGTTARNSQIIWWLKEGFNFPKPSPWICHCRGIRSFKAISEIFYVEKKKWRFHICYPNSHHNNRIRTTQFGCLAVSQFN